MSQLRQDIGAALEWAHAVVGPVPPSDLSSPTGRSCSTPSTVKPRPLARESSVLTPSLLSASQNTDAVVAAAAATASDTDVSDEDEDEYLPGTDSDSDTDSHCSSESEMDWDAEGEIMLQLVDDEDYQGIMCEGDDFDAGEWGPQVYGPIQNPFYLDPEQADLPDLSFGTEDSSSWSFSSPPYFGSDDERSDVRFTMQEMEEFFQELEAVGAGRVGEAFSKAGDTAEADVLGQLEQVGVPVHEDLI
ncbi:hypothetical protein ARMSODRAFT_1021794 [Armillaria solidipes]|uniref:Uncharacterized protein n=1 Tax=Armillaria solidipes TaxID=1076256 RepID=A0A2H3BBC2_9AGAR|nr:hypothetical protein ARMSODRAFT_1021794 [Armillaria solidipes]